MESTKYIGRVGALAVALGIGTALTSGTGIAWAEGGSGDPGKSTVGSSDGSTSSPGQKKTPSKPSGALSKIGERIRKDVESGLNDVGDALKQTQSRLDSARTPIRTRTPKPRSKIQGTLTNATDTGNKADGGQKNETARIVPEAVTTAPDRQRATSPNTVVVRLKEATANIDQRSRDATAPLRSGITAINVPTIANESAIVPAPVESTPEPSVAKISAPPVVSALLSVAGLSPFGAGSSPVAPAQSPALWAMMAWTRREFERSINPLGSRVVSAKDAASVVAEDEIQPMAATPNAAVQTDDLTPKPQVPASLADYTEKLGWVTGVGYTDHWYVAGTDLGIMWNSGYTDPVTGKPIIYTLFGDTYSEPGMAGDWRNNVLFRTSDTDLSNGLQFSDALIHAGAGPGVPGTPTWYGTGGDRAGAAQIIYDPGQDGLFGRTYTMIPTSAIAIEKAGAEGGYRQYATVMSIRTWDNPGSWTTNYSGIAYSDDGGKTWTVDPDTIRSSGWFRAGPAYVPGDEHFQQNALVMSDDPTDPYVYVYGTPSGRQGSAYVARVEKDQITNLDAYEYWAGEDSSGAGQWVTGDPSAAEPVFGSSRTDFLPTVYRVADFFTFGLFTKIANGIWVGGLPTNGNVSEMSVQYNEYLGKYVVLYTDGGNNVVMRVSDSPQGEWSDTTTLVNNNLTSNTGMYAPMVHPMSGTDYFNKVDANGNVIEDNSQYLYYNLSYWGDYNVRLMQTDLSTMKTVSV
ncbi:DUF4185 domain-containing protein [Mycolicibacterium boenickei]|uniref:DUF4185 domain-containing protein n=1 Tax=Mycolicibacterium boenickei TaxID=146017 RepID=A0AAX3A3E4_9MYCO|nr:DUF4185 domain-containing protein [Mycolicibacterium boenickei]PEG58127.1 DUF4185 domain-containing protein [Mycolicibacterium boenickei]UNC01992.1 DUF4185 domain-containing protein [Mycolicibacterium boenickei]BBX91936.1 hypothetical protein MBOE_35850 [Mycolicibacterium boenickei]